ncbi:hypothetical protein [Polaromonas sp.]|uniref:hypothetical protein n=1 Tax=Polaromonas sp. TaxID=1869339 RepID=UPI003563A2F1
MSSPWSGWRMRPWRLAMAIGLPAVALLAAAAGLAWLQADWRGQRLPVLKQTADLLAEARAIDALEKADVVGRFGLLGASARADQPQSSLELTHAVEGLHVGLGLLRLSPQIGELALKPGSASAIRIEERSIELQAAAVTERQLLELIAALPAHINGSIVLEQLSIERLLPVGDELLERIRAGERPEVLRAKLRLAVRTLRAAPAAVKPAAKAHPGFGAPSSAAAAL